MSTDSQGKLITESSIHLLNEWNCSSNIYGMVFDTTASNTGRQFYLCCFFVILTNLPYFTGHKTAACVSFQEALNRPLLWLACRRHVGEVLITHCWDKLNVEPSKSPSIMIFQR